LITWGHIEVGLLYFFMEKLIYEVSNAVWEQQGGVDQVLGSLKTMKDISYEVSTGSKEMNEGNAAMLSEMTKLQSDSREISSSMEDVVTGITAINSGVQTVSGLAESNQTIIKNITVIADGFEVNRPLPPGPFCPSKEGSRLRNCWSGMRTLIFRFSAS
jgi:methyl-accepting chemotaxis protein